MLAKWENQRHRVAEMQKIRLDVVTCAKPRGGNCLLLPHTGYASAYDYTRDTLYSYHRCVVLGIGGSAFVVNFIRDMFQCARQWRPLISGKAILFKPFPFLGEGNKADPTKSLDVHSAAVPVCLSTHDCGYFRQHFQLSSQLSHTSHTKLTTGTPPGTAR